MDSLEAFIAARKRNFAWLRARLSRCEDWLVLPEATPGSDPSWFGFTLTLRDSCGINRTALLQHLDAHRIGTRLLFAGNLTCQPYMHGQTYRVAGELRVTDKVMNDSFWIGVWPGLTEDHLDYAARQIEAFAGGKTRRT